VIVIAVCSPASLSAADVSGAWSLEFNLNTTGPSYRGECTFKQEGERITGSCIAGFESLVAVRGSQQEKAVTFQFTTGVDQGTTVTFSGKLDESEELITGTLQFVDSDGKKGEGTFTANRP
jgi:opacity protein-like surface antigen